VILPVLIIKNTQSMRHIIILYGAMFDFADVTENGILCWKTQFVFGVFWPLAMVIQEIHRNDCLNKSK